MGPSGKTWPGVWVEDVVNVSASVAVGSTQDTEAPPGLVVVCEISDGQLRITGGSLSTVRKKGVQAQLNNDYRHYQVCLSSSNGIIKDCKHLLGTI